MGSLDVEVGKRSLDSDEYGADEGGCVECDVLGE